MTTAEMLQQRAKLIADARTLHDTAAREKRSLTAEETAQWDKMIADAQALKDSADRETRMAAEEAELNAARERRTEADAGNPPPATDRETRERTPDELKAYLRREVRALARYLGTGEIPRDSQQREQRAGAPWSNTDAAGGYMAPTAVAREVISRVQDLVYMLAGSRVFQLADARAIQIPKLTTGMTAAAWSAETAEVTKDAASVFGQVTLTPVRLSMLGQVGNNLLFTTGGLAEEAILTEIAKGMAEGFETGFVAGTGSGQPTGVFNETSSLTTREVHTTSATGFTDWTDLVTAVGNQRATYRQRAAWLMHRDTVVRCMKLQDGEGRPVWLPSLIPGKPDTLLGYPIWESEFASNTFTADKRVAVFGDFSRGYGIALTLGMRLIRLVEKFAEFDVTGFVAHAYADGKVVDDNALTALHTATS